MRRTIFAITVLGVGWSTFGLSAVAQFLCGPEIHELVTCQGPYNPFCSQQNCVQINSDNTCPNGSNYNAVTQGPSLILAACGGAGASCTDQCFGCTTNNYQIPAGGTFTCQAAYLVCTLNSSSARACQ